MTSTLDVADPQRPVADCDRPVGISAGRAVRIIAGREISIQFRRRELWASLLITVIVLVGAMGLTQLFDGSARTYQVGVVGSQPSLTTSLQAESASGGADLEILAVPDLEQARAQLQAGELDAVIAADRRVMSQEPLNGPLTTSLQRAHAQSDTVENLRAAGLTPAQVGAAFTIAPLVFDTLDPDAVRDQQRLYLAAIAVFMLFFLMFMYGQGIAQGVLEEKTSRIVEVLLAKVRARQLLAGKVLGVGVVVLTQMAVILGAGILGAALFGVIDVPADALGVGLIVLVWFVPGFFLFATMWALAGALVSRPEDLQHAAGPVSLLQTAGIFAALVPFTGFSPGLGRVLSYLPGTSWAAMPVRLVSEDVAWWEMVLSLGLMGVAIAVLLRLGGLVYLGGALEHGRMLRARSALKLAKERGLS
ncbi:ABC-2 type transport system permease protein [Nakamurella sp. UYEF19]|uniref:ABC transporter permease n=1 Tax=Nakamurella sp. UYEF19 TaxID=1756392 RepID=UPI003396BAAF